MNKFSHFAPFSHPAILQMLFERYEKKIWDRNVENLILHMYLYLQSPPAPRAVSFNI